LGDLEPAKDMFNVIFEKMEPREGWNAKKGEGSARRSLYASGRGLLSAKGLWKCKDKGSY
jgi:hypothetical protein